MNKIPFSNLNYLKDNRQDLRNNLTTAEATLWKVLKGKSLGNRKFRRQHSLLNYIVDFYCPSEKLIIELDGEGHNDPGQSVYDAERDKKLTDLGYKILRFENKLVFNDRPGVLHVIESNFGSNING